MCYRSCSGTEARTTQYARQCQDECERLLSSDRSERREREEERNGERRSTCGICRKICAARERRRRCGR